MDLFAKILFILSVTSIYLHFIFKGINKEDKIDFFNVEVIDNHAQWMYNGILYYADIVDGKVDYSTRKKVSV